MNKFIVYINRRGRKEGQTDGGKGGREGEEVKGGKKGSAGRKEGRDGRKDSRGSGTLHEERKE